MGRKHMIISLPKFLFNLVAWLGDRLGQKFPFNSYKMRKLLGDECYSSNKLRNLGFVPKNSLQSAMTEIVSSIEIEI